ncbi:hypothetical protein [Gorillibacterium massiliense]|uniref:hypothetical protein n=1 Tax=Gorillibacterium massiliense TaxID=1280390 RepID=UPI0005927481|nr:hypothetical protein [Gorillibacterium massiliense]
MKSKCEIRWLLFIASVISIFLVSGCNTLKSNGKDDKPYIIELGYETNDTNMRIANPKTKFDNSKDILVQAEYSIGSATDNVKSRIEIINLNTGEIIQEMEWTETKHITGYSLTLKNKDWSLGTYSAIWKRNEMEVARTKFELTK